MTNFKIGDTVEVIKNDDYLITTGGQIGTIKAIDDDEQDSVLIDFDTSTKHWNNINSYDKITSHRWPIKTQYLKVIGRDNRTTVERKIRKLWNNSNWVKANPSQAY